MNIYNRLNEEFDNSGFDSISCYANITANVLNEGIGDSLNKINDFIKNMHADKPFQYLLLCALIGSLIGVGIGLLFKKLVNKLVENKVKKVKAVYLNYMTEDEWDEIQRIRKDLYENNLSYKLFLDSYTDAIIKGKRVNEEQYHKEEDKYLKEAYGTELFNKHKKAEAEILRNR